MDENSGMLFLTKEPRDIKMWMLNTLIPLDMLFFNDKGKIVYIHRNAQPNDLTVISSGQKVLGVIELNAGTADEKHIKQGAQIYFFN